MAPTPDIRLEWKEALLRVSARNARNTFEASRRTDLLWTNFIDDSDRFVTLHPSSLVSLFTLLQSRTARTRR